MSNQIRLLNNETLLQKTKSLAFEERKITLEILHHLQEISRQRLFAIRGFGSLFEYVTQELGYSDAAAQRRISAMRLLNEIPEVEEKIKSGSLSLSNAAQAQKLFQTEAKLDKPFNLDKKLEILETLENKSSREAEKKLIQHSSQPISIQRPDQIKSVTPTHSEIRFIADQALLEQLELVKGLLAHKHPHLSLSELIAEMAKLSLEKLQPKLPKKFDSLDKQANEFQSNLSQAHSDMSSHDHSDAGVERKEQAATFTSSKKAITLTSRYIPAEVKRAVYYRDQGKCQFVDSLSGRKCGSTHAIQYDHLVPYARGGLATVENLQIKCSTHNKVLAMKVYGQKMSAYLELS